jgi:hypothetical protein
MFLSPYQVNELCNVFLADTDPEACKIRITQDNSHREQYVLLGKSFTMATRTHWNPS